MGVKILHNTHCINGSITMSRTKDPQEKQYYCVQTIDEGSMRPLGLTTTEFKCFNTKKRADICFANRVLKLSRQ